MQACPSPLFIMFLDDMIPCISDKTSIALYADDTNTWRNSRLEGDWTVGRRGS